MLDYLKVMNSNVINKNSKAMEEQILKIGTHLKEGTITDREAKNALLVLFGVSGSASELETDMFKLINAYCKNGLKKPDLVKKMEWVTGSCKMS